MENKSPKVLFISRAYGEHAGGMERLSFELITTYEQLYGVSRVDKLVNETLPGISLLSARARSIAFLFTVIPKAVSHSKHVDVVHIGDPVLLLAAVAIRLFSRKPVVCTVHGLDVSYKNSVYQLYIKSFLSFCSHFVAISDYAKRLLLERGVTPEKVSIIPPGIVDHIYDPTTSREELSQLLQRDISNNIVVATTGRLILRKGHAWFIEHVIPFLPKNIIYAIAGNGPEFAEIASTITRLGLQDRIVMLGRISDADQKVLLNTIDAFIQPNIRVANDVEGFGIAPLEAALSARNVFAANVDGIPSAIHDGKNGTLLPTEDPKSWVTALTQYVQYPSQNIQAREYTKEIFDWNNIATQYQEAFKARA